MRCEKGDIAKIIYSLRPDNIGKIVKVESFIDKLKAGDTFEFRGVICQVPITDGYWWISADSGLSNMFGNTPKAYIPDSWLEPLRPTDITTKSKESAPEFI
jgi:hypothetical protein